MQGVFAVTDERAELESCAAARGAGGLAKARGFYGRSACGRICGAGRPVGGTADVLLIRPRHGCSGD
jgi:hypothetical protein